MISEERLKRAEGEACPQCGPEIDDLCDEIRRLRAALTEIAKGEGRFSRDPLEHASNTVDDMKAMARKALEDEP